MKQISPEDFYRLNKKQIDKCVETVDMGFPPIGYDADKPDQWQPYHWKHYLERQNEMNWKKGPAKGSNEIYDIEPQSYLLIVFSSGENEYEYHLTCVESYEDEVTEPTFMLYSDVGDYIEPEKVELFLTIEDLDKSLPDG